MVSGSGKGVAALCEYLFESEYLMKIIPLTGLKYGFKSCTVQQMISSDYRVLSDALQKEAHIWFCCPDEIKDPDQIAHYQSLLSEEEAKKHQRFLSESDQHSYLISHALVRSVLSKYADLEPSEWQFTKNTHGRPEIKHSTSGDILKFNLTHTSHLCACIVTSGMDCGIDAEDINRKNNLKKVAGRMFSSSELDSMESLNDMEYRKAFFKFWTLREAFVKALGTGLSGSSKDFSFDIDGNDISVTLENKVAYVKSDNKRWRFALFEPTDSHIAAVAVNTTIGDNLSIIYKKIVP